MTLDEAMQFCQPETSGALALDPGLDALARDTCPVAEERDRERGVDELEAELERVRGVLLRVWEALGDDDEDELLDALGGDQALIDEVNELL